MNLDHVIIVARKELKEIYINRGTWASAFFFSFLFAVTNATTALGAAPPGGTVVIDWSIMYLSLFIGTFSGFTLCGAVFFREKQSGVVETLLCTPLSLRSVWLGKVLGVAIPAWLFSLLSVAMLVTIVVSAAAAVAMPSLIVLVHLLVVAPLFTAATIGMVGYVQLAMGMKENRMISMVVFIMIIGGLTLSTGMVQQDASLASQVVLFLMLVAAGLLGLSYLLSTRLNKERIVTSIPD